MDAEGSSKLQELNNLQLKISSVFKDLLIERNDYKHKTEKLKMKLVQLSEETQNFKNEAETLKMQNEALRLSNEDMKNVIRKGIKMFRTLDFSQENLIKEHRISLETIKTIFVEFSSKLGSTNTNIINQETNEKNKNWDNDKEIEKKFEGLDALNLCTDFFCDEPHEDPPKNLTAVTKDNSDMIFKTLSQHKYEDIKKPKESTFDCEIETIKSEPVNTKISASGITSSKLLSESLQTEFHCDKSPVFKDFYVRRLESCSTEENSNARPKSLPVKLINEKFLEKSNDFTTSPWKKSSRHEIHKSPSTPKRVQRQLKINSPVRSPVLKKSNTREAEISFLGVRKLRQTFLNVNCYKKNYCENIKNSENIENENYGNKDEDKTNMEDDDIITESPKKSEHVLEDIRNKKSGMELNDVPFITPPQASDTDFDETFLSSSVIQKCNMTKKHELERVIEDQTPLKRRAKEKSPEYDSVPFLYKRERVRKKAERMKLPGHACVECNKYYENAFEDIDSQDLKKILNKCSRHRDKNAPALDDTPPGYWKPFLTISPNKNDGF